MTPTEIRAAMRDFLDLLENGRGSEYENWSQLIRSLDMLSAAYHAAAEFSDSDAEDLPDPRGPFIERHMELRALAGKRFPSFGFYNQVSKVTTDIAEPQQLFVGDAIDDLASIAEDLRTAEWRWDTVSEGHALSMFRLEFSEHTFEHLRCLQVFLLYYMHEQHHEWFGIY